MEQAHTPVEPQLVLEQARFMRAQRRLMEFELVERKVALALIALSILVALLSALFGGPPAATASASTVALVSAAVLSKLARSGRSR